MINILICTPFKGTGGISNWSHHLKNFYGFHTSTYTLYFFELNRSKQIIKSDSFLKRLVRGTIDYLQLYLSYRKELEKKDVQLIHLVSSASLGLIKDLLFISFARKKRLKTVIHFRFGRIPVILKSKNWEYKLLMRVIKKCDKVIVIDQSSYDSLLTHGVKNLSLLPNPLSERTINLISKIKVKREVTKIVFAGHMVETKGVIELIKACENLAKKHDLKLSMNGLLSENMKEKISVLFDRQIPVWLSLNGNQPYEIVLKEMLSAGVFVLPTYTEGFPNVILESMACACPIVSTPVGAIPEMLDVDSDKDLGLLVPIQNIDLLEKAIERMLVDRFFANECAQNAKVKVYKEYTMEKVSVKLENIWEEVTNPSFELLKNNK